MPTMAREAVNVTAVVVCPAVAKLGLKIVSDVPLSKITVICAQAITERLLGLCTVIVT